MKKLLLAVLSLSVLTACGGGGGSTSSAAGGSDAARAAALTTPSKISVVEPRE